MDRWVYGWVGGGMDGLDGLKYHTGHREVN